MPEKDCYEMKPLCARSELRETDTEFGRGALANEMSHLIPDCRLTIRKQAQSSEGQSFVREFHVSC